MIIYLSSYWCCLDDWTFISHYNEKNHTVVKLGLTYSAYCSSKKRKLWIFKSNNQNI